MHCRIPVRSVAAEPGAITTSSRSQWQRLCTTGAKFSFGLLPLLLVACGGVDADKPSGEFEAPVVEYRIVFEDDFDGTELDAGKWNVDLGDGCPDLCGWGNNELQEYQADNISVAGGILRIEGREEAGGGYTSGRINTRGKFDFQYGRVEVSARIPSGQGTWPAIWLLHTPLDRLVNGEQFGAYGPWPYSGEIDIMEAFNYGVDGNQFTQSTTHYGLPIEPFVGTNSKTDLSINAHTTFREYAVEWENGRIRFFVDGQHFQTQIIDEYYAYYPGNEEGLYDPLGSFRPGLRDAPFDQLFHLIINFAIGGNPVGDPDAGTVFPQTMEVEYVRIYECVNSNPDTRRGCGTASASIKPLKDLDGSPLEGANTAKPFVESLDLYLDGPEVITVTVGENSGTNTLQAVVGFAGDNATVVNEPLFQDPDDAENTVWHVSVTGDVANVLLTGEDLTDDLLLETGFDFSSAAVPAPVGEIAFDMQVNSITAGTNLVVKLDSGFPNLGEFVIPEADLAIGAWKTYSVKFATLLANPGFVDCCGGQGVDLENVLNPFVLEVQNGDADVYLDNIRATNACYVVGGCTAAQKNKGLPDVIIFDDVVNPTWDKGIVGTDNTTGPFVDYTTPDDPTKKVNWAIIDDPDPARGQVIDVTFNDLDALGVLFIQSTNTVDLSAYSAGDVVFDIIVTDYGDNTTGMTYKADCVFPCSSGDKSIGIVGDGVWEEVRVPVSSLTATGLDLTTVNTPINIFPVINDQLGTIRFRVDNIRWVAESTGPALSQIDLPVTFDDPTVDYTLIDFGGTSTVIVDDPEGGSNQVAQTTHNGGQFAGTVIGTDAGFANGIPFTQTETTMSVRVWSPTAGIPVMLKVEDAADPNIFAEVIATTTGAGAWETLVYDYVGVIDPVNITYEKAVLFFNFPNAGDGSIYYWDDVSFGAGGPEQINLPVTFDDPNVDYSLIDFGGTSTVIVDDPLGGPNQVAQLTHNGGAFAGTVIGLDGGFATAIPFTATDTILSLRVWSPAAGIPVMLKVEDSTNGALFVEVIATTTVANEWETLLFDYAAGLDLAVTYDKAALFFNFPNAGDGAVYFWDDLAFGTGAPAQIDLPVTFDDPAVDYSLIDFGGTATAIVDDPLGGPNQVAQLTHNGGAFAGTVIGLDGGFATAIPFTATDTMMNLRVWSPAAGIPVMLKVEDSTNGALFVEVIATTTVANEWEFLEFDYAAGLDLAVTYDKAAIFFNFPNAGDGSVYFWDDLSFGPAPLAQIDLPVTFDDPTVDYSLIDFGGTATAIVDDPLGGPNQVAQLTHNGGAFAGTVIGLDGGFANPIPFTATDTILSLRVWSPNTGIPIMLKVEDSTNGALFVEVIATTTVANAWETLVFDYAAGLDLAVTYDKSAIFFNFPNAGDGSVYFWDDLTFGVTP